MEIKLSQVKVLLDMFDGDKDTVISVSYANADRGHSGKGLYAAYSEYPEEGSVYLGDPDI